MKKLDPKPIRENENVAPNIEVREQTLVATANVKPFEPKKLSSFVPSEASKKAMLLDETELPKPKAEVTSVNYKYHAAPLDQKGERFGQMEPWEKIKAQN